MKTYNMLHCAERTVCNGIYCIKYPRAQIILFENSEKIVERMLIRRASTQIQLKNYSFACQNRMKIGEKMQFLLQNLLYAQHSIYFISKLFFAFMPRDEWVI